jgi:type II secretory pathway pseudopilin PulG
MKPGHSQRAAAFSLVEVTLAVVIMGFAFVAILGLVPVGLNSFRTAKNVSTASQISQQIFSEVQATAWAELTGTQLTQAAAQATPNTTLQRGTFSGTYTLRLPAPTGPLTAQTAGSPFFTRYFNDQGTETVSTDPTAVYQANVRVLFGTPWVQPGAGTTSNPDLATVLVQIAYVPSQQAPDLGSGANANLWTGTAGGGALPIQIFTFQTCVARNF